MFFVSLNDPLKLTDCKEITLKCGLLAHFLNFLTSLMTTIRTFVTYYPVALSVFPVADLIGDVLVQGRGGGVGAGPSESPASITCVVKRQVDWRLCPHCKTHSLKEEFVSAGFTAVG